MALEINKRGMFLTAVILASICYILYYNGDEINPDAQPQDLARESEELALLRDAELNVAETEDDEPEIGIDVEYTEDYINISGINVFYVITKSTVKHQPPPRFPVLLLHGAAFKAHTWKSIGTLQFLCKSGYFPVAVDLPGFGKTVSRKLGNTETLHFMESLISLFLKNDKPVIISPSMSGLYSLPYIFNHQSDVRGFVPVAPVNRYSAKDYKNLKVPMLIVYGSLDIAGEETSIKIHTNAPNTKLLKIPNAPHPAYLHDPSFFHNELKIFLDGIYMQKGSH